MISKVEGRKGKGGEGGRIPVTVLVRRRSQTEAFPSLS